MKTLTAIVLVLLCTVSAHAAIGTPAVTLASPQVTTHSATLTWMASTSAGVTYRAYRSTVSGSGYQLLAQNIAVLNYIDSTVQAGATYFWVVTAYDPVAMLESPYSTEVTGTIPSAPVVTSISVSPNAPTLNTGSTQQFTATVVTSGGASAAVVWTTTCGAVSLTGFYTAPASAANCIVTATSSFDSTKSAAANVSVVAPPPPPNGIISFWPTSATPANISGNDGQSVELGMKFSSSAAGSVTGVRFYKATNSTGTHTGTLWSSTGTKLATGTFSGETASGWQTLTFASPVSITAGTTYIVSYHTVQYVWNQNYFGTALVVAPLTAPIGAGLYTYGSTSALPKNAYQNSNYWVDVLLSPSGPPPPPPVTITIAPTSKTLVEGGVQQFTATVSNSTNQAVTWATTGGTVGATGVFMAGNVPGTFTVTATSVADVTKSASAALTITAPPPTLTVDCAAVKAAFTETNLPVAGTILSVTGTIPGAPAATCSIPLP